MSQPIFSKAELLTALVRGFQPEYLFFWGHTPSKDGRVGKQCLSQWYAASFTIDGRTYPAAEHYMMAEKAGLFGDEETRRKILAAPDPQTAKRLGRLVKGFDEKVWQAERAAIVIRANMAKFGQNEELRKYLLETGEQVLVEASPYDQIWGIGLGEEDARARDARQWPGLNLLGFALMAVRQKL